MTHPSLSRDSLNPTSTFGWTLAFVLVLAFFAALATMTGCGGAVDPLAVPASDPVTGTPAATPTATANVTAAANAPDAGTDAPTCCWPGAWCPHLPTCPLDAGTGADVIHVTPDAGSPESCPPGEHLCPCGDQGDSYCVAGTAECRAPLAECPASCPGGEQVCPCLETDGVAGAYCTPLNAMCLAPNATCP
jgi:hypothetical protein